MALAYVVLVVLGAASVALARDCISQPATGLCMAHMPRYYYNANSGQCEHFVYGGCGGNQNNFKTLDECEQSCLHLSLEDCSAEPETGMCRAAFPRHYFDVASGTCKEFIYGGCGGNKNNFGDESECQDRCGQYKKESDLTLEQCSAEPETGMCRAYIPSYAFNPKTGKCEFFVYGGCGGNANRFVSEEHCVSQCGKYTTYQADESELTLEECSAEPETGRCRAYFPSFAFNPKTGKCEFFVYGGCDGNTNRFVSEEHCIGQCGKYATVRSPVTVSDCTSQPETGVCLAYIPSYFYNIASGKCETFVYGGCGGNGNRFHTLNDCQDSCVQAIPVVDERLAVGICGQAKEIGMCKAAIPRYYYDVSTGSCEKFIYGGCGGNHNNFANLEECHNTCIA